MSCKTRSKKLTFKNKVFKVLKNNNITFTSSFLSDYVCVPGGVPGME